MSRHALNLFKSRRKKLFADDTVRLWLVPDGRVGHVSVELERRESGSTKWTVQWRGRMHPQGNAVEIAHLKARYS